MQKMVTIEETVPEVVPAIFEEGQPSLDQLESEFAATLAPHIQQTETSASLPTFHYDAPAIPESYKQMIGPAVRHISFAERYQGFEAEPIDVPWAHEMERGMNDFIAIHGPKYGEVFEFVQCRSSNCVLAGYTISGYESQGASVIGKLSRQPWWQAGGKASSTHSSRSDDRILFVTIIPRFDD